MMRGIKTPSRIFNELLVIRIIQFRQFCRLQSGLLHLKLLIWWLSLLCRRRRVSNAMRSEFVDNLSSRKEEVKDDTGQNDFF